jgi:hypothetical protein
MSVQNYDRRYFLKAIGIGAVSLAIEGCVSGSCNQIDLFVLSD